MKSEFQEMVTEFHRALDFPVRTTPTVPSDDEVRLRARLILEETREVMESMFPDTNWHDKFAEAQNALDPIWGTEPRVDLPALAHELADLHYVVSGTAVQFGFDERPVFQAIHAANCAKAGGGKDERGKAMKPVGWCKADIAAVLREQGWTGEEAK